MKTTKFVSGAVVLAFALTACGGDDSDPADSGENGNEDGGEVGELSGDLTVWIMQPGESVLPVLEATVDAFEAEHPDVTVTLESVPWDSGHDQFVTAIAGGDVPDVAELGNTWLLEFAEQGALAEVEWPSDQEFVSGLGDSAILDGTAYGYPWYAGVRALIYRTDIFDTAGVEPPTTWEDVLAAGDEIEAAMPEITPIQTAGIYPHMFQPLIWGEGGDIAAQEGDTWVPGFNTDAGKAALGTVDQLWQKGWSAEGAVQWNSLNVREDFALGNTAMVVGGGWDLTAILGANPDLEGKLGVTLFPAGSAGVHDSFAGGSHLGVFEESDNKEAAKAFAEFMLTDEQVVPFAEAVGFLPGTVAGVEAVTGDDPLKAVFAEQYLEHSRFYPIAGWWGKAEGASTIPNEVQRLLLGETTVDEAAANIDAGLEAIID